MENKSDVELRDIHLLLEKTPGIEPYDEEDKEIGVLGPGERLQTPFRVRLTGGGRPKRENRFMVCFRAEWPDRDYGEEFRRDLPRTYLVMKYLNGI